MSKSYKKPRDKRYDDDFNYGVYKNDLHQHRKEKRLINAVRSKNIDDLLDEDDF
jgi:hypothetical protein